MSISEDRLPDKWTSVNYTVMSSFTKLPGHLRFQLTEFYLTVLKTDIQYENTYPLKPTVEQTLQEIYMSVFSCLTPETQYVLNTVTEQQCNNVLQTQI